MDDNNLQQQPPAFNGNPSGLRRPQPPMDMVSAIKKALVTPTDFAGRSRRSEFWWFTLFYVAAAQLAAFLFNAFAGMTVSLGAQYAVMVALMLPMLAVQVRRLHDAGHGGFWAWLFLLANIGIYGSILPIMDYLVQITANPMDQSIAMKMLKDHPQAMSVLVWSSLAYALIGLVLLVFNCQDSEPGTNEYGPSPKYNV